MRFMLALLLALTTCCRAEQEPEIVGVFVPGATPTATVRLPQGTSFVTPDGKKYLLADDVIVIPEGQWDFLISTVSMLAKELAEESRRPELEVPGEPF